MHVVFISQELYPLHHGGIGVHFYAQMHLLRQQGHRVSFLTQAHEGVSSRELSEYYTEIDIRLVDASFERRFKHHHYLQYSFALERALAQLHEQHSVDLIVAAEYAAECFSIICSGYTGGGCSAIPVLLELQGCTKTIAEHDREKIDSYLALSCRVEDFVIRHADYYTAPTRGTWEETVARLGLGERPHAIAPNLLNRRAAESAGAQRRKAGPPYSIVYVGRLERRKGVDLLLEAVLELLGEVGVPELELVLIGEDQYWAEYDRTFCEYWNDRIPEEFRGQIRFVGSLPNDAVFEHLHVARLCVFPSRWEPFGIVALEAMSAGRPVLVTRGTGLEEVVGKDYDFLFDLDQGYLDLKEKICRVLVDDPLATELSRRSANRFGTVMQEGEKTFGELVRHIGETSGQAPARNTDLQASELAGILTEYEQLAAKEQESLESQNALLESNNHSLRAAYEELENATQDLHRRLRPWDIRLLLRLHDAAADLFGGSQSADQNQPKDNNS